MVTMGGDQAVGNLSIRRPGKRLFIGTRHSSLDRRQETIVKAEERVRMKNTPNLIVVVEARASPDDDQ
jgi:hypothetical protein